MTNLEKYDHLFLTSFKVKPEDLPGLKYQGIPLWDSLGHMDLMGDLEETWARWMCWTSPPTRRGRRSWPNTAWSSEPC